FPVLESAIVPHDPAGADMKFTLDRGVVLLTNRKKEGAAHVKLGIRDQVVDLALQKPGTKLLIELYGRHHAGFSHPDREDDPTTNLVFIVLQGESLLSHGDKSIALKSPPGMAMLHWDSVAKKPETRYLDKLPPEMRPFDDKESKLFGDLCSCARKIDAANTGA